MFHEETNSEALARVTETLRRPDAGLLHAKIARPPAAADDFYKCSTFRVVSNDEPRDGTVFIAETGRLSNLKLRFIPDETVEREIREKNIGDCAVDETQRALEKLAAEQTKAKQVVEEKDKKRLQEVQKAELATEKLQEDCHICQDTRLKHVSTPTARETRPPVLRHKLCNFTTDCQDNR